MAINRVFLGWDSACLPKAAQYLVSRYSRDQIIDMSGVRLALPGSRAARRLLELLVLASEQEGTALFPPTIVTLGALPEELMALNQECISEYERVVRWCDILRRMGAPEIQALIPKIPGTFLGWYALARRIDSLYVELAGANLTFSDAHRLLAALPQSGDLRRWSILEKLHEMFVAGLDSDGETDRITLRRRTLDENRFLFTGELILVSTPELSTQLRRIIASLNTDVIALIHAPEDEEAHFDEFGCVKAADWLGRPIPLEDSQIIVARDPREQAECIARAARELEKGTSIEDVVIGIADDELIPYLKEIFGASGIAVHDPSQESLAKGSSGLFIGAAAAYIMTGSMYDLGSLVRHPFLTAWLKFRLPPEQYSAQSLLVSLDTFQHEKLPALAHELEGQGVVGELSRELNSFLAPLRQPKRTLSEWIDPILSLFETLRTAGIGEKQNEQVASILVRIFEEEYTRKARFQQPLSAPEAIQIILGLLDVEIVREDPQHDALELLGWLELQLDDAPTLFISGMSEGNVPGSVTSDLFLPNTVREALNLSDNHSRYARDAFLLTSMLNSRRNLKCFAGRRRTDGDGLLVSKLLLADAPDVVAARIMKFYRDEPSRISIEAASSGKSFPLPGKPAPLAKPIESMRVTGFRDYLTCPYRFYLRHVLNLEVIRDDALELDAFAFGNLAHEVFLYFGLDKSLHINDPERIETALGSLLDKAVGVRYGNNVLPSVLVQIEQLRARYRYFAAWQARWFQEGWTIHETEKPFGLPEVALEIEGGRMGVSGRIDRIDYHPQSGRYTIFDYKTGENVKGPSVHYNKRAGIWHDLQLPLYYYALRKLGWDGELLLGYIPLSAKNEEPRDFLVDWQEADLTSAIDCAKQAAKNVWSEIFWPPARLYASNDEYRILTGQSQHALAESSADAW